MLKFIIRSKTWKSGKESRFQPNLPLGLDGKRITSCEQHRELSKNAAKEGMVLLKNNDKILPLAKRNKKLHCSVKAASTM